MSGARFCFSFVLALTTLFKTVQSQNGLQTENFNVHVASGSIKSSATASSVLQFPNIIPALFGSMLFGFEENPKIKDAHTGKPYDYILKTPADDKISIWSLMESSSITMFEVSAHTANAFQTSLAGSIFVVSLHADEGTRRRVTITCMAPRAPSAIINSLQSSLVAGLTTTMLENVRVALGVAHCNVDFSLHSGLCNNEKSRGSRGAAARYTCGSEPKLNGSKIVNVPGIPSPRVLSNAFCRADTHNQKPSTSKFNFLMIAFGQFLDHDISLTPEGAKLFHETINITRGDLSEMNLPPMTFTRSEWLRDATPDGYRDFSLRRHFNAITAFIDASNVYGADNWRAWALRSFKDGKLRMNGKNLPFNKLGEIPIVLRNAPSLSDEFFVAGDIRANENPVLLALHTAFALEHNRICDLLKVAFRGSPWEEATDSWYYYQARKLLIAEMQNIVYQEFLPFVLGPSALPKYHGYNPDLDPSIAILHSTASYRWGHSGVVNSLSVDDSHGASEKILLNKVFFNPSEYRKYGIEAWLRAAAKERAEEIDSVFAPSIQDFLFNPSQAHLLDLASLNIMRSRDHGLCSYLESRSSFGLSKTLRDIAPAKRLALIGQYKQPGNIDASVGGLSETAVEGSLLGPLFHASNVDQFTRLRDGDRFFYENKEFTFGPSFNWLRENKPNSNAYILSQKALQGKVRLRDVLEINTNAEFPGTESVMLL